MVKIESRYREVSQVGDHPDVFGPWVAGPVVPDGTRDLALRDVRLFATYDVQLRRVDPAAGTATRWVPQERVTVEYSNEPADPVGGLRVVCGESLTWEPLLGDDELGGLRFRVLHAPGDHQQASDMVPAVGAWAAAPPFDLCLVPKGRRTLCVVPVDPEGQEGVPAFILTNRGPFDDADPVPGRLLDVTDDWLDPRVTIEGGSITGDQVWADPVPGGAGAQPYYIGGPNEPYYRGLGSDPFYATAYKELVITFRGYYSGSLNGGYDPARDHAVLTLGMTVAGEVNWRAEYRRNTSPYYIGGPADPYYIGGADAPFRHGTDGSDPFRSEGTAPYYPDGPSGDYYRVHQWRPWPGKLRSQPRTRIDFRLVSPASWKRAKVSEYLVRETLPAKGGKWSTGHGAPLAAAGDVGDFYLDADTGAFYEKQAADTWVLQGNLTGPAGGPSGDGWQDPIVIDFHSFQTGSTSKQVDVFHLEGAQRLVEFLYVPVVAFGGAGLFTKGDLGTVGTPQLYLADADLQTPPGSTVFSHGAGGAPLDLATGAAIYFRVVAELNLSGLSSGRGLLYLRTTKPY